MGGTPGQQADLSELIWDVPQFFAYIRSGMVLATEDVIAVGTPAGAGPMRDGGEVPVAITNIHRFEVTASSVGTVACPTHGRDAGPPPPSILTPPRKRDHV